MRADKYRWLAAILTAVLLELPFPLAGPMPAWRSVFAWFGLVPLILAALYPVNEVVGVTPTKPRLLRNGFKFGYLAGVLWYMGNCYWIYDTMLIHGHLSPSVSLLLLIGYSLVLGLYFGIFTLCLVLIKRATGSMRLALVAAPFLWAGIELAAARITCVPWDQLGYSQVDNPILTLLAPWTGVYGISFVLVAANALLASSVLLKGDAARRNFAFAGVLLMLFGIGGLYFNLARPTTVATAMLVQPNLDVQSDNLWNDTEWKLQMLDFQRLASDQCTASKYIPGIPELEKSVFVPACIDYPPAPALIAWPESPAPFYETDAKFKNSIAQIAKDTEAPIITGGVGIDFDEQENGYHFYNSALVISADGERVGRYDKIHLVPYGEYIPFQKLFSFAHKLTGRVGLNTPGTERKVFLLNGHHYGVFICYEAVFADEVRQFAQLGGEVFVNISDDGWYGNTSAPWQHLNMTRMRAIENRRWILRDTNDGVTAAIDPNGIVRQSIARHERGALAASFGFVEDRTFYTMHGDLFAWGCAILSLGVVGWAGRKTLRIYLSEPKSSAKSSTKTGQSKS
jgi:apolipoprotein N-acyltransferase